jgi:hypothetical protein
MLAFTRFPVVAEHLGGKLDQVENLMRREPGRDDEFVERSVLLLLNQRLVVNCASVRAIIICIWSLCLMYLCTRLVLLDYVLAYIRILATRPQAPVHFTLFGSVHKVEISKRPPDALLIRLDASS